MDGWRWRWEDGPSTSSAKLALVRHRHAALRRRAWELRDHCSAYDTCYVALAELLGAGLLTTDTRLAAAARGLVDVTAAR